MILVVCAVGKELRDFARDGVRVVAVGIGPVEAALGTARALAEQRYDAVVNAGIAGGFAGHADVGEALVVRTERYADIGREDGGELMSDLSLADRAHSDSQLVARALDAAPWLRAGDGVTSAVITTSDARRDALVARFDPACESMEGFAVLRAAAAAGVRAIGVRGISNIVGDRAASRWDFRAGSAAAVRALHATVDALQAASSNVR